MRAKCCTRSRSETAGEAVVVDGKERWVGGMVDATCSGPTTPKVGVEMVDPSQEGGATEEPRAVETVQPLAGIVACKATKKRTAIRSSQIKINKGQIFLAGQIMEKSIQPS